jgi:hypothetical protein
MMGGEQLLTTVFTKIMYATAFLNEQLLIVQQSTLYLHVEW